MLKKTKTELRSPKFRSPKYEETKKQNNLQVFRLHTSYFKLQRGVSILLTSLIMSVILAIGLGLSTILIQQTKMMGEVGYSIVAFFAADTGIEEVLMMVTPISIPETQMPNGAEYKVDVFTPDGDCTAPNYCIKSFGTFKETKRAIEIKY